MHTETQTTVCATRVSLAQEQEAVIAVREAALQAAEAEKLELKKQLDDMHARHGKEISLLKEKLEVRSQLTMIGSACCTLLLSLGTDASISKACTSYCCSAWDAHTWA